MLRLLFCADPAYTRGTMTRAEDGLICRDIYLISQVLSLHLTLLMLKRNYIGTQVLLISIHVANGIVMVMLRKIALVSFCLLICTLGIVLSMDVH
jgi:hypothetical protein